MPKFPVDAPRDRVIRALETLGFELIRQGSHIAMARKNEDGSLITLTLPNHRTIKSSTLRTLLTQSRISREEFLAAYYKQ